MRYLAVMMLALGAGQAIAQSDCSAAETQTDMSICAGEAYRAADAELNAVYTEVMDGDDAETAGAIREAQRLWIPFRDAACAAEGSRYAGGSMEPMVRAQCLTRLTEARVQDLQIFLEGY